MAEEVVKVYTTPNYINLEELDLTPKTPVSGYSLKGLNDNTLGKFPGLCVLFGAPSGVGKTAFTYVQIAKSIMDGKKVALCTTETDPADCLNYLKKYICADKQFVFTTDKEYVEYLKDKLIIFTNIYCVNDNEFYIDLINNKQCTELYIDYLDATINFGGEAYEKSETMAKITRQLNDQAALSNLFIWVTAQYKGGKDVEPDGYQFRKSSELMCPVKQCYVLMKYKGNSVPGAEYELTIAKNSFRIEGAYLFTEGKIYLDANYNEIAHGQDDNIILT